MRTLIASIAGLVLLTGALARPLGAVACTGCSEPLADVVREADRVLLVTVADASQASGTTFTVQRVLKGQASGVLSFPSGATQDYPIGSRWILVLYPGHGLDTANAWRVEPDGRVVASGPFTLPATLAGFLAFFMPATDAVPTDPGSFPTPADLLVLGAALLVVIGLVTWRARRPVGH
jgi:hypothetical protein